MYRSLFRKQVNEKRGGYLCTRVKKLGIKVSLKEATPQSIAKGGFNAAVIAIGGKQASPDVHGTPSPMIVDALAVLRGEAKPGKNIVVVGGGYVGLEIALYMGEKGKSVTVVECRDEYGTEYERGTFVALQSRLAKCDVTIKPESCSMQSSKKKLSLSTDSEKKNGWRRTT